MEREEPNRKIAGVSLQGRVEKTDRETVYIKLDIDGQNGSAAYPYPWAPITAGLMYSMPQPGTKAYLYFPDCHEENAIVVDAIHTREPNDGFGDVQNRGYVTEHGKMLLLYRDSLCIRAGRQKREQKFFLGEKEISLCTGKGKMSIVGQGDITFYAPEIRVTTPQRIVQLKSAVYAAQRGSIYPKGSRNPPTGGDAAFSMQYEFNGFAEQGILIGTQREKYKPFEDAPYVQDCPTWMKVVAGILVAALVGLAIGALVFATGGAAAFIIGVTTAQLAVGAGVLTAGAGMLAAGATYVHDKKNGTESSLEEYVQNALNASVEVGESCVKLCIAVYDAQVATLLETGGVRVGVDVLRQVLRANLHRAGWSAIINIGFQVEDVKKFAFQGKELGAPTKNIGYDFSKSFTESVTNQYVLLGTLNPFLYVNAFRSINSLFGGATEAGTELILQGTTSGTGLMLQETAVETSYALQGVAAGELALPTAVGNAYAVGTEVSTVLAIESATQKTLLLPGNGGGTGKRLIPGTQGVVTGGDSTKLGKNMMESMGLPRGTNWTGYQAQHIIPAEMANHPVLQKIGMDLDDASNGLFLRTPADDISTMSRHRGYHSTYNEFVKTQLDAMDINQSVDVLQKQVYDLQQKLKYLQQSGLPLYPSQGATVDLWQRSLERIK